MENTKINNTDGEVIKKGLTNCWLCGKAVKGKAVIKDGATYFIEECPVHGVNERLLGKGVFSRLDEKEIPSYWPRWEAKLGMPWDDKEIINRKNIPVLILTATSKCNSSCKICGLSELKDKPSAPVDINTVREKLSFYRGKEVILCGGEPTIVENLPELIRMIKKTGNKPVIQTNGLRLAKNDYLRELKRAGLEHVHFSFDGFKEEIYERVRGGKHEYHLKLTALDNLIKENIRISLSAVAIKGITEDQIPEIVNYAAKTRQIVEVIFYCFALHSVGIKNGFTIENILSSEEVKKIVAESLSVSEEDFLLWDEFKINLALYLDRLKSILPFLSMPVFRNGMIYLKRGIRGISPLLNRDELNSLIFALENSKFRDLFTILGVKVMKVIGRNCFIPLSNEDLLYYRENMLKICVIDAFNVYTFSPASFTTFGFYDPNIGLYNKIHQR